MELLAAEYDNMLRCIRCAACLTSCPTYVVTHKEEEGPRGRMRIDFKGVATAELVALSRALWDGETR